MYKVIVHIPDGRDIIDIYQVEDASLVSELWGVVQV